MKKTWVWSLCWEDLLEKGKANHSSVLAWRIPERLKAGREGGNRGWDDWMASPTQWTQIWVSSRSWWWTGKPGMLQSMGSQRVGHNWATELNWINIFEHIFEHIFNYYSKICHLFKIWASLIAQLVKNLPAMQDDTAAKSLQSCPTLCYPFFSGSSWPRNWTRARQDTLVQFLGQEDPLKKG